MCIQPFLYKKDTGRGVCTYSNTILAQKTHWSVASVKRYNTWLIQNGYLDEEVTDSTDETGLPVIQKSFNLTSFNQAVLWAKQVTEQVSKNTDDIEELKAKIAELEKWKAAREKEDSLLRNKTNDPQLFSM